MEISPTDTVYRIFWKTADKYITKYVQVRFVCMISLFLRL